MPLVIGVEGPIASGKSTVCRTLVQLGARHCDVDHVSHAMYEPGRPSYDRVVAAFGPSLVMPDGRIDRKRLGDIVFGSREEMARLQTALGSIVDEVRRVVRELTASLGPDDVLVVEAMDLVGLNYPGQRQVTWLVACEPEASVARLVSDRGLTAEEARKRIGAQRSWRDLVWRADHVFINDASPEDLAAEVSREYESVLQAHRDGTLPAPRYETGAPPNSGAADTAPAGSRRDGS